MKNTVTIFFLFLTSLLLGQEGVFTSIESGFSVYFEKEPYLETQAIDTEVGKIDINMFMVQGVSDLFMVSENKYPESMIDFNNKDAATNTIEGAIAGIYNTMAEGTGQEPKITAQEYFKFNDQYHAMRSIGKAGNLHVQTFVLLKGNIMYQVICVGISKPSDPEVAAKFFSSFKLI
ncbi:MAG: hypothetical protein HRT68_07860 [Flavobacteriaceae bacterium]|nr:hypothetical protein [Flavobacteriaceae bacterium]